MRKRILLLNPPSAGGRKAIRSGYCNSVSKGGYYWAPIDLLCQSGILAERFDVDVLDATAEGLGAREAFDRVGRMGRFDGAVGLTSLASKESDLGFLKGLRDAGLVRSVVLSGGCLLFDHKDVFERGDADGVLLDYVSRETVEFFEGGRGSFKTISTPGRVIGLQDVAAEDQGEFQYPVPLHLKFPIREYYMPHCDRLPMTSVAASLGCPHRCSFCTWAGLRYRCRDVENTLQELDYVASRGIREVMFVDPLFGGVKSHAKRLLQGIAENGIDIAFSIECRVNLVDDEFAGLLRRAGCHDVMFGVESGDDGILKGIRKGFTVEDVRRAFKVCKKHGIGVTGHFIFGLPGETEETIRSTIALAKEIDCDFASFNLVMTLPGTDLYEKAVADGAVAEGAAPAACSDVEAPAVTHSRLTPAELRRWADRAFRSFYLRPGYVLKALRGFSRPVRIRLLLREFAYFLRNFGA
ncbi:MAG: radical SAM protein [Elusimicrobiota bacterium]|jgi:radical SAM superfamily enzyme YgiQ (UPF0313 family)